MRIRTSTADDRQAISALHLDAFGPDEGPEIIRLVDDLFADPSAQPLLSLVADDGEITGHVMFTAVHLPEQPQVAMQILAPLAVARTHQGNGVGSALVREGLERLAADDTRLVFVLGHPGYYPRFGFRPAGALGLDAPYPVPDHHADAWMVQALGKDMGDRVSGQIQCARALDHPAYWCEQSDA